MKPETVYPLTIFHDGNCPICRFEVANLQLRNQEEKLRFIDITSPDFDPAHYNMAREAFFTQIQAQRADGNFVSGIEVFQLAYRAAGLGWIVAPTHWKGLAPAANVLYRLFARNRNGIGRYFGWIFEYFAARLTEKRINQCNAGSCAIDSAVPAATRTKNRE